MENHASNPAGRLWLYFTEMAKQPSNEGVSNHAATYFGAHGFDARYMRAMADLMQLPDEAAAMIPQILNSPIPAETLQRPLEAVRNYFRSDPLGTNPVNWMSQQVGGVVLSELNITSHMLNTVAQSPVIPEGVIEQIRVLASEIIDLAMADEGLDPDARAAFIQHAHRISEAADLYKVTGPQRLVDELDRFHKSAGRMKTHPGEALWGKTKQLVGVIVVATELFTAPAAVTDAIDYYGDAFTQQAITEAPAPYRSGDIVDAEIIDGESSGTS